MSPTRSCRTEKGEAGSIKRVPAPKIEQLVLDSVRRYLEATEIPGAAADRDLIERARRASLARPESVAPLNFASESNDLQVYQRALLDETLDALLDVFQGDLRRNFSWSGVEEFHVQRRIDQARSERTSPILPTGPAPRCPDAIAAVYDDRDLQVLWGSWTQCTSSKDSK